MQNLRLISFVLLLAALLSLSACKKSFEDFNTIINVVLPEDCQDCDINILDPDEYFSLISAKAHGQKGDVASMEIDWEVTTWIDPLEESLLLGLRKHQVDTFGTSQIKWYELLYSQEGEIKPGKIYKWDPLDGTLKSDGKTEKKIRKTPSGHSNNGNNNSSCDDDPVTTKYKERINGAGRGCQPCATCAALACAKYLGDPELIKKYTAAVKQEEEYYETKTCPELY